MGFDLVKYSRSSQCFPNLALLKSPFQHLLEYLDIDEFMEVSLERILFLDIRVNDQAVTPFTLGTINNEPKFSARSDPIALFQIRKSSLHIILAILPCSPYALLYRDWFICRC